MVFVFTFLQRASWTHIYKHTHTQRENITYSWPTEHFFFFFRFVSSSLQTSITMTKSLLYKFVLLFFCVILFHFIHSFLIKLQNSQNKIIFRSLAWRWQRYVCARACRWKSIPFRYQFFSQNAAINLMKPNSIGTVFQKRTNKWNRFHEEEEEKTHQRFLFLAFNCAFSFSSFRWQFSMLWFAI